MDTFSLDFDGQKFKGYRVDTVVLGSGAAGFAAADRLTEMGMKDVAIVTENVNGGTSRNTGSDKQTYYKLSMAGSDADSVRSMAEVYFSGQCVDGDHALCEAALSSRCFIHLVDLGVPFPCNAYGEYVGYKTDHDPACRATSAGPYTSKMMTECLEREVRRKNVMIFDKLLAVRILKHGDRVAGLLCLDLRENGYVVFICENLVFATGGPAGMYADSVYPAGHIGASGLAFEAGALGKNLTEWQFGLASIHPRWNVSGTYMQSIPRFVSTDQDGNDEREFLLDFFMDADQMNSLIFLKGYQWPFDVRKVYDGSSIIDILVFVETKLRSRRVFLDFRENPSAGIEFEKLSREAYTYLSRAGACFGKPIDRLRHMNQPAVDFFGEHGIDLAAEKLEIALCAQHNNGGIDVDEWWQSAVGGLYVVGEAAATHGVYRPGGSALNAGQVGALRAATHIVTHSSGEMLSPRELTDACGEQIRECIRHGTVKDAGNVDVRWRQVRERMSRVGGAIRNVGEIRQSADELEDELRRFDAYALISTEDERAKKYRLRQVMLSQLVYLRAMEDYCKRGGRSRGSALYADPQGSLPSRDLPECFRCRLDSGEWKAGVQTAALNGYHCRFDWRPVRAIPEEPDIFENVWREYRRNGIASEK